MRRRLSLLVTGFVIVIGLIQVAAVADETPRTSAAKPSGEEAEVLFLRGSRLARDGKYREALETWTKGYVKKIPEYRDLEFKYPVEAKFMGREKLREFLLAELAKEYPDEKLLADQIAYAKFGFFDESLDLKKLLVDLMTEQIAGFYDPDTKGLYLIAETEEKVAAEETKGLWKKLFGKSGKRKFDATEQRSVLSHELAYALADQHFDLNSLSKSFMDDDDQMLAVTSLIEGEAMLVMMLDAAGGDRDFLGEIAGMQKLFSSAMELEGMLGADSKTLREAPLILKESLIFPYMHGMLFCSHLIAKNSWRPIDKAFANPPRSSEQILHPEKYTAEEPDEPLELRFASKIPIDMTHWEHVKTNLLGEFGIEVLFRPELREKRSQAAAAGWDGDVYSVYKERQGDGRLLVWATTWDSRAEAKQFSKNLVRFVKKRNGSEPSKASNSVYSWKENGKHGAIWQQGVDVGMIDGASDDEVEMLLDWSRKLERSEKKTEIRKFPTRVQFRAAE